MKSEPSKDTWDNLQIKLVGIVGSIIIVTWVSGWEVIVDIFKPDHLVLLSDVRVSIASLGLIIASIVGIKSLLWLIGKLVEFKTAYQEAIEFKKKKDEG